MKCLGRKVNYLEEICNDVMQMLENEQGIDNDIINLATKKFSLHFYAYKTAQKKLKELPDLSGEELTNYTFGKLIEEILKNYNITWGVL